MSCRAEPYGRQNYRNVQLRLDGGAMDSDVGLWMGVREVCESEN